MGDFFNPPAANVPTPQINTYQPQNFSGADTGAFGGISNLSGYNLYPQLTGQATNITNNLVNNPYAAPFQAGAGTASTIGQNAATNAFTQGQSLYNLATPITSTAFDPQNALYNQQLQQTQDQARAANAAAGVATTPYGAGLENQALNNFNINWQNNQLGREISGANAAGSLIGQGAQLQGAASPAFYTASGLPYSTAQGIGTGQFGALSNLGQFGTSGAQIPQQQVADYLNYLGWGTGQQGANNKASLELGNFQLNQAQDASQEQAAMFGGLGKALGGATDFFFPGGFSMSAPMFGFGA